MKKNTDRKKYVFGESGLLLIVLGAALAVMGTVTAFFEWLAAPIIVAPALFITAMGIDQFYRTHRRK